MSQAEIEGIIAEFRETTCDISEEDVENVLRLCRKKIEITGKPEDYMELLLPDELKNYCFRMAVNAISFIKISGEECRECAVCV